MLINKSLIFTDYAEFSASLKKLMSKEGVLTLNFSGNIEKSDTAMRNTSYNISWQEEETI